MKLPHHFFAGFAATLTAILAVVTLAPSIRSGELRASTPPFIVVIQTDLVCGQGMSCDKYGNPFPQRKIWECVTPTSWAMGTCTYTQIESCNTNAVVCPSTYVCDKQSGECKKRTTTPREPGCGTDADCNGQVCVYGKCYPCTTSPFECEGNLICNAGLCEERPPEQPKCSTNEDCGGRVCYSRNCYDCDTRMLENGVRLINCPNGTYCDGSDGVCKAPVLPEPAAPVHECDTHEDCGEKAYCHYTPVKEWVGGAWSKDYLRNSDGTYYTMCSARQRNGFECSGDYECLSDRCSKWRINDTTGVCSGVRTECPSTTYKNGNVCSPKKGAGDACSSNNQCVSNICSAGVCTQSIDLVAAQASYDAAVEARDAAEEEATEAKSAVEEAKDAYSTAKEQKSDAKQAYLDARAAYKAADEEDKADAKEDMDAAKADYLEASQEVKDAKANYLVAKTAYTTVKAAYAAAKRTAKTAATVLKAAQKI